MKKQKLIVLTAMVLVLAIISVSYFGCRNGIKGNQKSVKIGVILPLTGKTAAIGEPKKKAFDIALEQYNKKGQILEFVYEDSHGSSTDGITAFNKLLLDKSIDCYYIDLTPIVNACIPQINSHKVITFAGSAEPEVTNLSDYLFRLFAGGDQEIEMMVDLLNNQSVKRIYILHTNELYGINSYKLLKKLYEEKGGIVLGSDEYPMNNGDFKAQLVKAKKANADKIVLLGYGNEYPSLLRQSQELGLSPSIFVCNLGGSNSSVIELPSALTEGMSFIGPRFSYLLGNDALEPEMKKFVDIYMARYDEKPDFRAAYAYDMVNIFMNVYGDGTKTQEELIEEIKKIQNYKGTSGTISFMDNGDTKTDLITAKYSNGSISLISNE